ncbi:MAG: metallophosphoesterase [Nocardioides sp.]|uniref:metallophosphoesterase n=1 Tax=Nocardioides sp. TaxID=35761 RepID=UPI0039E25BD1
MRPGAANGGIASASLLDLTETGIETVAVIGDVGGHLDQLRAELVRLGVGEDGSGALPAGLVVVQVGDLVHRGPDSDGVVELVELHLGRQPDRWIQLVGNHEAWYLRRPSFSWDQPIGRAAAARLREWWTQGRLRAAVALRAGGEELLVSHAGLTEGFWRHELGAPATAEAAAERLNRMFGHDDDVLFRGGQLLGGGDPDPRAGPLWASAGTELLPGWLDLRMPFGQVHGHSTLRDAEGRIADARLAELSSVDLVARHETTLLEGGRIVGVDPGHGAHAAPSWRSWRLVDHDRVRRRPDSGGSGP